MVLKLLRLKIFLSIRVIIIIVSKQFDMLLQKPVTSFFLFPGTSADQKPISWYTRMKIAYGTAQGLEFLHEKADPPVIYRELKPSTILLDEDFNPKLSDIGLAKGDKVHVSSMVMDTNGYSSPEYTRTGQLTLKSDVYSFGVVMLELITGKSVMDTNEPNLVAWV